MQTTRFLESGNCRGLHLVHLDESPVDWLSTGDMLCSWLEALAVGIAVDMRKDTVDGT